MKSTTFAILALIGSASLIACRDSGTEDSGGGTTNPDGGGNPSTGGNDPNGGGPSGANGSGGNGNCTVTEAEVELTCGDGIDNDCDDFEDCNDFDCEGFPACIKPGEANNYDCSDGVDNDEDGFIDCDDNDGTKGKGCQALSACTKELSNAKCSDGEDNDGDGDMDCDDIDCQTESIVVCDGATPVTGIDPADYEMLTNAICTNGINDDASPTNTFIDCNDNSCLINPDATDCRGLPREGTNALCSNGDDDDKDSLTDCDDPNCQREGIVVCNGTTPVDVLPADYGMLAEAACTDGDDNDTNTFVDCNDFGCSQNPDVMICPEANDAECSDNIDNDDTDDFVDCDDFSCSANPNVTVCGPTELSNAECGDGISNNNNPFIDCNDFSCKPSSGTPAAPCL